MLHTIVFNRALGHVRPVDVDSELFDVTYVRGGGDPGGGYGGVKEAGRRGAAG